MVAIKQDPSTVCLTREDIISNGGSIIENSDGSVSVYVSNSDGSLTYRPLTKPCCEALGSGYTFDINNQLCMWGEGCSDNVKPFKVVLNPQGNDGVIFTVNESSNENCSLDISFDYLIQFNCSDIYNQLVEAQTGGNQLQINELLTQQETISNQITALQHELTNLQFQLEQMPFVVQCLDDTYCLTEDGLIAWQNILGVNDYNLWYASNGSNTSLYGCKDVGNLLALDNDSGRLLTKCKVLVTAREEFSLGINSVITQINELQEQLASIQSQINELQGSGECSTVSSILETLNVCMTLELVNPTTGLLETIYEESIFNIGDGQIATYLTTTAPNTGLITTGSTDSRLSASTEEYDSVNCQSIAKTFMEELSNILSNSGTTQIQNLVEESFNSPWLNFDTSITDQNILDSIYNEKIKISFKIKDCCVDFSILVDRIRLDRNCETIDAIEYDITKSPSFEMIRTCDNKKSWLSNEDFKRREFDLKLRETEYDINNYKLAINSKEVDLNISPSNAIEQDLFCYVKDNNCILDPISSKCIISGVTLFKDELTTTVLVTHPDHGFSVNDIISISGASPSLDTDLEGYTRITNIVDSDSFQYEHHEQSPSITTSGTGVLTCYEIKSSHTSIPVTAITATNRRVELSGISLTDIVELSNFSPSGLSSSFEPFVFDDQSNPYNVGLTTPDSVDSSGFTYGTLSLVSPLTGGTVDVAVYGVKEVSSNCGDYDINLNEIITTELSGVTTLKEFNDTIHSELIDVKGWKTESAYPTLRLLYDRYMNSSDYCDTISSQFNYCDMIKFSELVGTYWVDLIEQVVPSTTIWGSTYVYGNTLYDQQKFKYKKYTLFGCSLLNYEEDVVSPTSGWTDDAQFSWEILPNENYDDVSGSTSGETYANIRYNRTRQPNDTEYNMSGEDRNPTNNNTCSGVGIMQINCGSEFIGKLAVLGKGDPTSNPDDTYQIFNTGR